MAIKDLIRTNGDHHIQAQSDIVLETKYDSGNTGTVWVYGNLFVQGATTELESNNISIGDKILILNKGEPGVGNPAAPGITQNVAGIRIQRYTDPDHTYGQNAAADELVIGETSADWVFNELRTWTVGSTVNTGMWQGTKQQSLSGIATDAIRTSGVDLSLLGSENANAVITVKGTNNYHLNVTDDDDIPNRKWTELAIYGQPNRRKIELNFLTNPADPNTLVADPSTYIEVTGPTVPGSGVTEKQARVWINGSQFVTFYDTKVDIGQLRLKNTNEITMNASGTKLVLSTFPAIGSPVNPDIEIKSALSMVIDYTHDATATEVGKIKLYPGAEGPAGSGLYFVNSENTRDELPSKRRAFFTSLMF